MPGSSASSTAGEVGRRVDHRVGRAGDAAAREVRLLRAPGPAQMATASAPGRHRAAARQGRAARAAGTFSNSVVTRGADLGQLRQAVFVEVVGVDVVVGDRAGRAGRVRVEHRA